MDIGFCFEVVGNFQSKDLWKRLKFTKVNLIDTGNKVFVYGQTNPTTLLTIIIICCNYGTVKGGEFICE